MGQPHGQQRRGGKKNRKHRRNFRWAGVDHSTTKYRQLHHIAPDAKRRKGA
jgi:hypothetical protein